MQIKDFGAMHLEELREKFIKKENLRIRIFGDSHTAADISSSELRENLFKPDSIGFVYPIFPTYHANTLIELQSKNFEIINSLRAEENYPMGGIVARAQAVHATIMLDVLLPNKNFTTQFVYMSPNNLAALEIKDQTGKKITLGSKKPNTWEISKPYNLSYPITIDTLIRNVKLGGYFIYRSNQSNNILDHVGINGARSDLWLKWDQEIFHKELRILQYDLIILAYGTNDAISNTFNPNNFSLTYRSLIHKLRRYNTNSVILLVSPPTIVEKKDGKYKTSPNLKPLKQAILKIAKTEKTLLLDIDDLMEKTGSKKHWIQIGLSKNDVHLTPLGYKVIGSATYEALKNTLER